MYPPCLHQQAVQADLSAALNARSQFAKNLEAQASKVSVLETMLMQKEDELEEFMVSCREMSITATSLEQQVSAAQGESAEAHKELSSKGKDFDALRLQLQSLVESHRRQQDELQQTAAQRSALSMELTQLKQAMDGMQHVSSKPARQHDEAGKENSHPETLARPAASALSEVHFRFMLGPLLVVYVVPSYLFTG